MVRHRTRFVVGDDNDHDDSGTDTPPVIVVAGEEPTKESGESQERRSPSPARLDAGGEKTLEKTKSGEHLRVNDDARYPPTASLSPSPSNADSPASAEAKTNEKPSRLKSLFAPLASHVAWIQPHLNWKGFRPVLRSSVAVWCGLLLLLGSKSQAALGQASFLVLIVGTISPAANPVAPMLEITVLQLLLVLCSWAWSCIAIAIAHASRTEFKFTKSQFEAAGLAKFGGQGLSAAALSTAIQEDVFHGAYLESQSSAVCAVFLGVGVGFLLWLRGYIGPAGINALFGIIFAVIIQTIVLTIAVLFPYPWYSLGSIFFYPFACQLAINLVVSLLVFPETLAHQFSDRLIATLGPMQKVISLQKGLLSTSPRSTEWLEFKSIRTQSNAVMAGVGLLGAAEANLTREISFARISGKDLTKILGQMRVLAARTTGFVHFYKIVELHLHRQFSDNTDDLVIHLAHSRPASPDQTPASTRPPSPTREHRDSFENQRPPDAHDLSAALSSAAHIHSPLGPTHSRDHSPLAPTPTRDIHTPLATRASFQRTGSASGLASRNSSSASLADLAEEGAQSPPRSRHESSSVPHTMLDFHTPERHHKKRARSHHRGHHGKSSSHISLPSLLHDVLHANVPRQTGMFESQKYMDLEDYLANPRDEEHIEEIIGLLSAASEELISTLDRSVGHLSAVIHRLKASESTWRYLFAEDVPAYEAAVKESQERLQELEDAIKLYRDVKRLDVIRPFAALFDPFATDSVREQELLRSPSHRGLYWAFTYEFSLLGWADAFLDVFKTTVAVEKKRRRPRLWMPEWVKFSWGDSSAESGIEDVSPDRFSMLDTSAFSNARDPDARPPKTRTQAALLMLYNATDVFSNPTGGFLFFLKIAVVYSLVSMPAYFKSTSYFFYRERGVWVLIMVSLTSTQYVGDTTFSFVVRFVGTLSGGIIGLLMWSIAAQTGKGNPYAVAAVVAVALPFLMFFRVHFKPPISAILPPVTAMLVIGYSWQDAHAPALSTVGYGFDVAWRRVVCVSLGITIAFIAAFLPPRVTQKATIRRTYANVIGRMGGVLCQILSHAHVKGDTSRTPKLIVQNLAVLRAKVGKSVTRTDMVRFEFSLRGRWPAENYASLRSLQMELLDLMGQLAGVLASLPANWTKALLYRSQLSNPVFVGDMLTAFQLISSALEHGQPLPMVYNPLLERFLKSPESLAAHRPYGYDIVLGADHEIEGIPKHVDMATICSLEYMRFSCGISQCYAIVNRLDRLMFVAKALVGENYMLFGLESGQHRRKAGDDVERELLREDTHRDSTDSMV